jgi:hypothetical protein
MKLLRDESLQLGALPPTPPDLSHSCQNDGARRQIARPPLIPAAESALGLRPRSTLSSAQVFPEWITTTSPWNDLSTNGDNPLTRCLTPGVQFTASAVCPSSSSSLSSSFWRLCNDVSFESTDPRE